MGRKQIGFSLVELMVAMALGLVLCSGIISAAVHGVRVVGGLQQSAELVENGRYLILLLEREVSLAGFYGTAELVIQDAAVPADICATGTSEIRASLLFPLDGINNAREGQRICNGETLLPGTDALLVRRAEITPQSTPPLLKPKQHYIQAIANKYQLATGDSASDFTLTGRDGITPVPLRAWHQTIYYVASDNVFKRRRLIEGRYSPAEPLAEGVDDFQITFGIDRSGDGQPNADAALPAFTEYPESIAARHGLVALKLYILLNAGHSAFASAPAQSAQNFTYAGIVKRAFDDSKKRRLFEGFARRNNRPASPPLSAAPVAGGADE